MRASTSILPIVLAAAVVLPMASAPSAWARGGSAKAIEAIDTDKDGTIDLKEAQTAAEATFEKAEADKDGTVTAKELGGRLSKKDLKEADGDGDGSLDKKEYLALVEQRFKAADPDGDGKLDAKELKTPAGKSLLQLLR